MFSKENEMQFEPQWNTSRAFYLGVFITEQIILLANFSFEKGFDWLIASLPQAS